MKPQPKQPTDSEKIVNLEKEIEGIQSQLSELFWEFRKIKNIFTKAWDSSSLDC